MKDAEGITPEKITEDLKKLGISDDSNIETKTVELKEETLEIETPEREDREELSLEDQAKEKGWNPEGEKSAEEFLRAEPLYNEIKARGKEIKELKSTLDELKSHMDKQRELGYKQAMNALLEERNRAIELGDVQEVNQVEHKIRQYNDSVNTKSPNEMPEVNAFLEKHKDWLNNPSYETQQMREFTAKRDQELSRFGLAPEEHLRILEKDLKTKFPSYFGNTQGSKASAVESGASSTTKTGSKTKHSFNDLSPEQKDCARHFERMGVMKKEEYIKQLEDMGEL